MTDQEALRLALGIAFALWCVVWVLQVGFLLDQWMWWRKTRKPHWIAVPDDRVRMEHLEDDGRSARLRRIRARYGANGG